MKFLTVSIHLKIFAARVLCEYGLLFFSNIFLKYLLPQCCFNMVCDCPCRPTSASQVYIYIHMSMRFITVSMHLQVIGQSAKIWQNKCHQLFVEGIILHGVTVVDDK